MSNHVLSIRGLTKYYGQSKILSDVSFSLEVGALVALVGPNGTGKSTLLKLITRLELPDSGEVLVHGQSGKTDHASYNEAIGYVSEAIDYNLPLSMLEIAHLMFSAHRRWDQALFEHMASLYNLPLNRKFSEVSRGQKMQFVFAVAIAKRPQLLILDEVTSVLDASVRLTTMKALKRFTAEGGTVLLATNILTEVQNFAERLIILDKGRVTFDQKISTLRDRYVKLRKTGWDDSRVFYDPSCREVGLNSDGTSSFLIPRAKLEDSGEIATFDKRGITAEDLFVYYTRKAA